VFLDVRGEDWFCLERRASISRFLLATQVMSGVGVGCCILSVLIRFVSRLLGFSRYGVCDDALCSDQDLSVTVSRFPRFL